MWRDWMLRTLKAFDRARGEFAETMAHKEFSPAEAADIRKAMEPLAREAATELRRDGG